jgi:signal peptidase I
MDATRTSAGTVALEFPRTEQNSAGWRQLIFGSNPNRTLKRVLIWGFCSIVFFHNLLLPIQIIGSSMSPTYKDGSYNFINKVAYATKMPRLGDVIACEAEGDLILKRIIALPGDTVSIHNGVIQINGAPIHDNFARSKVPWEMDKIFLKPNEFWVIGDNRANSVFCKIHKSQILGKIIF